MKTRRVENPWMVGKEEEVRVNQREIGLAVEWKNEMAEAAAAGLVEEEVVEEAKVDLRESRCGGVVVFGYCGVEEFCCRRVAVFGGSP